MYIYERKLEIQAQKLNGDDTVENCVDYVLIIIKKHFR
ncbi:hypothetical protein HPSSW114_1713 [Glaesserella parasuis SW114]|nr:hypothetical protein HPSSW114_1713 [Glaesserella parasuis SW114]EQA07545.1 hypothetical protein HPS8415995_1895 [Glaesserella parasuis 84-15995]